VLLNIKYVIYEVWLLNNETNKLVIRKVQIRDTIGTFINYECHYTKQYRSSRSTFGSLFVSLLAKVTLFALYVEIIPNEKIEQCINLKFLVKLKKYVIESFHLLTDVYGDDVMS